MQGILSRTDQLGPLGTVPDPGEREYQSRFTRQAPQPLQIDA